MKELSIEEKAKAYDKAVKRAKRMFSEKELNYLFPELKESEGDIIKKDLIEWLEEFPDEIWRGHYKKECIAWLEKQGQTFTKKDVDDAYLKGVTNTKNEIEKQYEANYQIRKDIATFIFNYKGYIKDRAKWMEYLGIKVSFAEKQGENYEKAHIQQNDFAPKYAMEAVNEERIDNANKVEPKFHEGDWITDGEKVWKIGYIEDDMYIEHRAPISTGGIIESIDKHYHLWTIEDAKDGDVLVSEGPFIFKGLDPEHPNCPVAYCGITPEGYFHVSSGNNRWTDNKDDVQPATKKQRDNLFQMIKGSGYEWDAEKLELKKIEQKQNFNIQIDSSEYVNNMGGNGCYLKNVTQVSAWSEEDELRMENILSVIEGHGYPMEVEWIKSLKDRVQPQSKQEWSEEDKRMFDFAIRSIGLCREYAINHQVSGYSKLPDVPKKYEELQNWLKSLKGRLT